jgi:hypothetical protein
MNRIRTAALAALMVCAVSLGAAGTASAAQQPAETPLTQTVNVTGTKGLKGKLAIDRFATRNGKMVAIGTLTGTVRKNGKTKRIKPRTVSLPATLAGTASGAKSSQIPPIPGACTILNLSIAPINLNLLGLSVRTNQIDLRIDAVPGAGNLLGNLLCSVTNLLNPGGALGPLTGAINQLTAALNAILALVPMSPGTAAAGAAGR